MRVLGASATIQLRIGRKAAFTELRRMGDARVYGVARHSGASLACARLRGRKQ